MPYNNVLFPVKSNTNTSQSRSPIDLVKLSSNAYWRFAIFFSLATVLQAIGFNRSAHADTSNSNSTIIGHISSSANNSKLIRSAFLPRIINLIAVSAKYPSGNSTPSITPQTQSAALKSAPLQTTARSQILLADAKSLGKSSPSIHQVKQGETITAIATKYRVSKDDLVRANQLQNSNVIFVNQRLTIPDRVEDKNYNTLPTIANLTSVESQIAAETSKAESKLLQPSIEDPYIAQLKIEIEQRRAEYKQEALKLDGDSNSLIPTTESQSEVETSIAEGKSNSSIVRRNLKSNSSIKDSFALVLPPLDNSEEYLPSAFDGYIWPAQGVFTSGYGWRWGRMHRGIDIAAPIGTPIVAAAAGTVIGSGWHSGYGNMVKLEHLDGSVTYYAHNHRNLVTHGQQVKQGEQIAEMGSTGQSTGSHLHFEIHLRDKKVIDPLALLGKR